MMVRRSALFSMIMSVAFSGATLASDDLSGVDFALPWDNLGGPYQLTDQYGQKRTERDPDGRAQLLFFGYANCPGICSAALPMMADLADALTSEGFPVTPVLITIDPKLDTVETLGPALKKLSNDFVGLTGDAKDLEEAYQGFQVTFEKIMDDPEYGPIYAHGSYIYLLNADGKVQTTLPPVLSAEKAIDIVRTYANQL